MFKKFMKAQWRAVKRDLGKPNKTNYTAFEWIVILILALWVSSWFS